MKSFVLVVATAFLTIGSAAAEIVRDKPFRPGAEVTFPGARRIYVVPGAQDSGGAGDTGMATTIICTNTSDLSVNVTVTFFGSGGTVVGTPTTMALGPGRSTYSVSSKFTLGFGEASASTGSFQGSAEVSTTESGVFCRGLVHDASSSPPQGTSLHMVRFRMHTGTQE